MTNIEMEMIKAQIDKVITYSQDISNPKTDYVMEQWAKNKQRFINKMNGKLIYEFPEEVSFLLVAHIHLSTSNLSKLILKRDCISVGKKVILTSGKHLLVTAKFSLQISIQSSILHCSDVFHQLFAVIC